MNISNVILSNPVPLHYILNPALNTPWKDVVERLVPRQLLRNLSRPGLRDEKRPEDRHEPRWWSQHHTFAEASVVHWLQAQLETGRFLAFGRRAGPDSSNYVFIHPTEWQRLPDIDHGSAWRMLFSEISSFQLYADQPAWNNVGVVSLSTQLRHDRLLLAIQQPPMGLTGVPAAVRRQLKRADQQAGRKG